MAAITASAIKELRDRTGIGMAKCKVALEEAGGDLEKAIADLRKAGMAAAVKKSDRETKEGMIAWAQEGDKIAMVEARAETDFVVNNENFQEFLKNIVEEALKTAPASLEAFMAQPYSGDSNMTVEEYRASVVQKMGENVQISRVQMFDASDRTVGVYMHMGGKIGVVVEITGCKDEQELAKGIAMHVAASNPEFLSPETVPSDVIEKEKDIAKAQVAGKPENIIDKIVEGKMRAYYDDNCLTKQKYIKDDKISIEELVAQRSKEAGKELAIANFTRWSIV